MSARSAAPRVSPLGRDFSDTGNTCKPTTLNTCSGCGSSFAGPSWKQLCGACWRWRTVGWHVTAASRAFEEPLP